MRILNVTFKPSTDLKRMVEILSNIDQNVRFTASNTELLFEPMNPVHGVSTYMYMSAALFQTYYFDANPRWTAIINANEFSNLLNSVNDDDQKVEISIELDYKQQGRILFVFYDMDGVVRLPRMMDCQPIGGVSELHILIKSIIQADGLKILMLCTNEFKNALERSSNHNNKPVEVRITNDMIVVSCDPDICFLDKGTEDYMTNDFPRKYSIVQVSLYEAKYIAETASVAELCALRVITNEASALALPLLLQFFLEDDRVLVYFTLPSDSVARPQLL